METATATTPSTTATTTTTTTSNKKNSLCRYFIRFGDCFHGDMCRYLHAYPPQVEQPQVVESPQPTARQLPQTQPQPQPQNQYQHQQQHHPQPPPQQSQPQNQGYNMNKLVCSFKSDLPNEIDFAMQVATLLANTDNFTWYLDYPLIDAICSSLHVFVCVCEDLSNCYCYPRFWRKLLTKNYDNQSLQASTTPPDMSQSYLNFNGLKNHTFEDHKKIYRRIKSTAELLKQFSMTIGVPKKENDDQQQNNNNSSYNYHHIKKKKLKASPALLKFVSLLLHCDDAALNLIGLDILSDTASKLSKIPDTTDDPTCSTLVQMFQEYCVDCISRSDGDIYTTNRSIEVVSRLISSSSRQVSSSIISQITEKNLILKLEQFLISHYDVTLFLSALEFCYRISRHQPHLLTTGRTRYLMKILVNLLNCDDRRYFTPNALKKIKLIDEEELTVHHLYPLDMVEKNQIQPAANTPRPSPQNQPQNTQINSTTAMPATQQPIATPAAPQSNPIPVKEYTCEWNECNTKYTEAKRVYTHVFEAHIGPMDCYDVSSCLWSGPNGLGPGCLTKRPKYSLLTHLNDFHCNPTALERALNRSQPIKPPEHPGYAPNAALLAIKRHANAHIENSNGNKNSHNQSPLSVSVRLTAALILRNLATESPDIKQALENYEPLLSEICMSNGRDEAKIIAECLSLFSHE